MFHSDGRWVRWGGLAGVFVFWSVALTGVLWLDRPGPDVRGEDAAELAAAAFEREWALARSADAGELPPRFGPGVVTAPVCVAEFDVAGVVVAAGSERPLRWTGVPGAWGGAKTWRLRAMAALTDRVATVRWTLGGASVTSFWTVAGSQSPTGRADTLGDPGGRFAEAGFRVSPPVLEGFHDPRSLGAGGYLAVSVEPDPGPEWPTNGEVAAVFATNTPGESEAVWPHMPSSLVWGAACRLRSAFLSRAPAPFWVGRTPPGDGECAVTGAVEWLTPGWAYSVSSSVTPWLRSPGDLAGSPAFAAGGDCALLGAWSPDPDVPPGGRWRQLAGVTNNAGLFTAEDLGVASLPLTNTLWECRRAGTNMAAAAAWADCAATGELREVSYAAQSGSRWLSAQDALGETPSCHTNAGWMHSDEVAWGQAYSDGETLEGYYGATNGYASADGGAWSGVRFLLPPGWPCASACASGLVSRVRVYGFPYVLDWTSFGDVPRGADADWSASGLAPADAGELGCRLPAGGPPGDAPGGGAGTGWEVPWLGLPPVSRPAALLAEVDPAALAGGTGVWFAVETGLEAGAMAAFAAGRAASRDGVGSAGEGAFRYYWSGREEARSVSVCVPRRVLVVAEFAFGHLAEGAEAPEERREPAWMARQRGQR